MRTRFARADVAGNDDADRTRYQTPASTRKLRSTLRACPPMRSAAGDGGTLTLPLVALVVAPLIEEATVIGDADAAPRHGHRRAARERAGIRAALRAARTGERYAAGAVA